MKCILARIEAKQKEGWTFVFLGANQDSYAEGGQLGYNKANIQNFAFDGKGTKKAWEAVSMGCFGMRQKMQNENAKRRTGSRKHVDSAQRSPHAGWHRKLWR